MFSLACFQFVLRSILCPFMYTPYFSSAFESPGAVAPPKMCPNFPKLAVCLCCRWRADVFSHASNCVLTGFSLARVFVPLSCLKMTVLRFFGRFHLFTKKNGVTALTMKIRPCLSLFVALRCSAPPLIFVCPDDELYLRKQPPR